jgi:rare lipoprotein A
MMHRSLLALAFLCFALAPLGAAARLGPGDVQKGVASYYHDSLHGRTTASGAPYNKTAMTAAHKSLPLGTKVRVTEAATGRSIVVKINDRGPFVKGRIIDLSRRAARELGMEHEGLARVRVEVLSLPARRGRS